MKIYDLVKELLTRNPDLRDSDKKLIWRVWDNLNLISLQYPGIFVISNSDFMKAPSTESIRRCRQKIQETHPELRGSKWVISKRQEISDQKGTHIYREEVREQTKFI